MRRNKKTDFYEFFRCSLHFEFFAKFLSKTLFIARNNVLKVFLTEIESEYNIFGQEMIFAADN